MATAINTTVKLYKGIPLVKGGTEVLYLSGAAAEGALSAAASAVLTYNQYYYTRENRGSIQVDDLISNCEGSNYVGFQNVSHGGKWYFGFVDQIVYINDNCTEIRFTIDPFTTYLGDTSLYDDTYVVRNTLLTDVRGANLQPDYLPKSVKTRQVVLDSLALTCNQGRVLFAGKTGLGYPLLDPQGYVTGIQYGQLTPTVLESIKDDGGTIIGAYLEPAAGTGQMVTVGTPLQGNPLAHMSSYNHEKLRTGVYTQVALAGSNVFRTYELEEFANVNAVTFGVIYFRVPAFAVFVYPKNYKGIAENTAEGIYLQAPSLSISAQQGYTNAQMTSDIYGGLMAAGSGAISGAAAGGWIGAIAGGIAGLAGGALNMAKNAYMSKFNAPQVFGGSIPVTADDMTLRVTLLAVSPDLMDGIRIDRYFDYYGYNLDEMQISASVNTADKAYLQTGSEFLHGSEADVELNARIMSGIKIRKSLT